METYEPVDITIAQPPRIRIDSSVAKYKAPRCFGNATRNPYLNFLHEFRKCHKELSGVECVRQGAKEWRNLPNNERLIFVEAAFYAPRRRNPLKRRKECTKTSEDKKSNGSCPSKKEKKKTRSKEKKCGKKRKEKKEKAKKTCAKKAKPKEKAKKKSGGCKKSAPKRKNKCSFACF